ncbi:MAG TPA: hypothetical protein VFD66_02790, partial [Verrucomicrobiae bacterium]|nr:hypothetical protein [Verrucomicrobiae bacterium]
LVQPASQRMVRGGNGTFAVIARGSAPLAYQWQFDGADIPGATNSTLLLSCVQSNNLGTFRVVISNACSTVVSSNATIELLSSLLLAWGNNQFGKATVPATLSNVTVFAAGSDYSVAVNADGSVVCWGLAEPSFSPAPSGILSIAAGITHMLALQTNGAVIAAGDIVPATVTNAAAIAAGYQFSLALLKDGSLVAWGNDDHGQTNVPAGLTNGLSIACGEAHCLVLKNDGTVDTWGYYYPEQTNVPADLTNIVAVAAGWSHSLALRVDGTVVAWGNNDYGKANIPPGLSNVVAISAGWVQSMALKSDGTVVVWGDNSGGQTNVPFAATNVVSISSGAEHCLALLSDGSPQVAAPLFNHAIATGDTLILNAGIVGAAPMHYQWQLNGTNIAGATNALLVVTNLLVTSAGGYHCVASNALGSVVTSDATVAVSRQPLRFDVEGLRMTPDGMHLHVLNLAGAGPVMIEASSDLLVWHPILLNPPVVGSLDFIDLSARDYSIRFYRASEGGSFEIGPVRFDAPAMAKEGFSSRLTGLSGHGPVIVYASTNLRDWEPIYTNPPTVGAVLIQDATATNARSRFYRAEQK